jgi:hypothetical protein
MFLFTPVLADINGDGTLETIAGSLFGKIYAISPNGQLLHGFPIDVGGNFQTEPAAADFNGDGTMEIVAGSQNGLLYVLGTGGTVLPGFPVQLNGPVTGSPTITNTNRIVCSTPTHIYIISAEGNIIAMRIIDALLSGGFDFGRIFPSC